MHFLIRFDVAQPDAVGLDEFHAIWDEEARATQAVRDAGVLQGYKVADDLAGLSQGVELAR